MAKMKLKFNRRNIIAGIAVLAVIVACIAVWQRYFSTTKVAFVNYQVLQLGQMSKANDNSWIKLYELSPEELEKAGDYDMVFVNGMGLRVTAEQREALIKAANSGTPVLSTAVTNPDNYIVSVDSVQAADLAHYLSGGGRTNYRNLLSYVRRNIDRKITAAPEPGEPVESASDMMYHSDFSDPDGEDLGFNSEIGRASCRERV